MRQVGHERFISDGSPVTDTDHAQCSGQAIDFALAVGPVPGHTWAVSAIGGGMLE